MPPECPAVHREQPHEANTPPPRAVHPDASGRRAVALRRIAFFAGPVSPLVIPSYFLLSARTRLGPGGRGDNAGGCGPDMGTARNSSRSADEEGGCPRLWGGAGNVAEDEPRKTEVRDARENAQPDIFRNFEAQGLDKPELTVRLVTCDPHRVRCE